jgi:hypothetical protein
VVVLNKPHRPRLLRDDLIDYHRVRTHRALSQDSPEPSATEGTAPTLADAEWASAEPPLG